MSVTLEPAETKQEVDAAVALVWFSHFNIRNIGSRRLTEHLGRQR